MLKNRWLRRILNIIGVVLAIALVAYFFLGNSGVCTGISLLLVAGAMLYLRQMERTAERNVFLKIQAEYPSEIQPEIIAIYEHMKIKELDGLFVKILDDAKGDLNQVRKLASIAENVGWKAFIENHW